jgi:hypothetical protein
VIIRRSRKPPVIKDEILKSFRALEIAGKDAGFRGLDIPPSLLAWQHHYFDGFSRQHGLDTLLNIGQTNPSCDQVSDFDLA